MIAETGVCAVAGVAAGTLDVGGFGSVRHTDHATSAMAAVSTAIPHVRRVLMPAYSVLMKPRLGDWSGSRMSVNGAEVKRVRFGKISGRSVALMPSQ